MRCPATMLVLLVALGAAESDPAAGQAVQEVAAGGELLLSESDRQLLGEPSRSRLSGDRLRQRTEDLAARMRCPVCQGLSVADSPTPAARAIKARVEALLAAGYSDEQVLTYFEGSYGEFIRLAPKPQGLNLVAWLLPVVVLLLATAWLAVRVRRHSVQADEPGLDSYLRQVREEVDR